MKKFLSNKNVCLITLLVLLALPVLLSASEPKPKPEPKSQYQCHWRENLARGILCALFDIKQVFKLVFKKSQYCNRKNFRKAFVKFFFDNFIITIISYKICYMFFHIVVLFSRMTNFSLKTQLFCYCIDITYICN